MLDILHRDLVDRQTRLERIVFVSRMIAAMGRDPVWRDAGDIGRRRTARRLAFAHWRFNVDRGWQGALRNRQEPRP